MTTDIQRQIAALVERAVQDAFREGYAAGQRDALATIVRTAHTHFVDTAGPAREPDEEDDSPAPQPEPGLKLIAGPGSPGPADGSKARTPRVRRGAIKELVRDFVNANPGSKESHFAALHPTLKRSSCYMAYQSLANEGVLRRDGKYWFPASMQWFSEEGRAMPIEGGADRMNLLMLDPKRRKSGIGRD